MRSLARNISIAFSGGSIVLACLGVPLFVWAYYGPYTEWAYQTGVVWRILAVSIFAGLVAAVLSSCAATRLVFARTRGRRPAVAASVGPSTIFLPSMWLLYGAAGLPGAIFVAVMTVVAFLLFFLIIRLCSRGE